MLFVVVMVALSLPAVAQEQNQDNTAGSSDSAVTNEFDNILQDDANYDKTLQESIIQPKAPEKKTTEKEKAPAAPQTSGLAGLGGLSDFNDIAVINRKFLPKTKRFEIYPNVGLVVNDAFFNDLIYGGRIAFYFSEYYGIEATGLFMGNSNKLVTDELATHLVTTSALVFPTSYYGADFKWSPLYGKIGWLNKSIVPFDLYLSAGAGITGTNQHTQPFTFHLGLGQMFALSKWLAFRWDVSYYGYNSVSGGGTVSGYYSNIHANIGLSLFFPGAEYR